MSRRHLVFFRFYLLLDLMLVVLAPIGPHFIFSVILLFAVLPLVFVGFLANLRLVRHWLALLIPLAALLPFRWLSPSLLAFLAAFLVIAWGIFTLFLPNDCTFLSTNARAGGTPFLPVRFLVFAIFRFESKGLAAST